MFPAFRKALYQFYFVLYINIHFYLVFLLHKLLAVVKHCLPHLFDSVLNGLTQKRYQGLGSELPGLTSQTLNKQQRKRENEQIIDAEDD